jgi:CubicO group peptidase (beta-lactamase class C family)
MGAPAFLFLVAFAQAHAQDSAAVSHRVSQIFAPFDSTTTPGCAVGIARDGRVMLRKGFGMSNLEYAVPLTAESILESGSVAKQFTAAAVVLLQLEGKLSLDDDIRKYLPEVPDFGQTITIRMLLTHTSGLRDQWGLLGLAGNRPGTQVHTMPLILNLVSRQRDLNFPPGSEYLYSNTNFTLAAMIVARVSGQPFATFTRDRFFTPLGMTHTQWRDDYRRIVPGRATAYEREKGAYVQSMPFTNVHGNGGLLTTVGDLLLWNEALTHGTIAGGKALVDLLETRGTLTSGTRISYALGLGHGTFNGAHSIGHSGSTAGYQTYLVRYPDQRLSIAVLCNSAEAPAGPLAQQVAELFIPKPAALASNVAADTTGLGRMAGMYRNVASDDLAQFTVAPAGLRVRSPAASGTLTQMKAAAYAAPNGASFVFDPSPSGNRVTVTDADGEHRVFEQVVAPKTVNAAEYVGRYRSPELDVAYTVRADGARLLLDIPLESPLTLSPLYADGFMVDGRTVRFVRDGSGKVTGFRVFAGRVRNVRFDREQGR